MAAFGRQGGRPLWGPPPAGEPVLRLDLKPRKTTEFPSSSRGVTSENHRANATVTAATRPDGLWLR